MNEWKTGLLERSAPLSPPSCRRGEVRAWGQRASPRGGRSARHRRLVAVNERRGKASRRRCRPPTGGSDSGWVRKASHGPQRRSRGVAWPRGRTGGGRRNSRRLSTKGAARVRERSLVEGRCALTAVVTPWPAAARLQTCWLCSQVPPSETTDGYGGVARRNHRRASTGIGMRQLAGDHGESIQRAPLLAVAARRHPSCHL